MWGKLRSLLIISVALGVGVFSVSAATAGEKGKPTAGKSSSVRPANSGAAKKKASASKPLAAKVSSGAKTSGTKKKMSSGPVAAVDSHDRDEQSPSVKSGSALVLEQGAGAPLFQKNAGIVVPIASITKLMTAMVVLDSTPDLQGTIVISDADVDYLRGSRSRLNVGASMTRETALLLALMSSENRAAHALGRHYPGGMPAFVAAMNEKARSLGMRDTHFDDPTGLSSSNVSTAYDLAKMVSAAYRYPLVREFSTTPDAVVEVAGRQVAFNNTNPLVKSASWEVGLSKTGYINEAGKCLVMQARVADRPVVIVLLDSVGKLTRVGDANRIKRWMEHAHASRSAPSPVAAVKTRALAVASPS